MAVQEAESRRTEGTADRQNNRPGAAIAEHTLIYRCRGPGRALRVVMRLLAQACCGRGRFLAFVPRTVRHRSNPAERLPSFPDADFGPTTPPELEHSGPMSEWRVIRPEGSGPLAIEPDFLVICWCEGDLSFPNPLCSAHR